MHGHMNVKCNTFVPFQKAAVTNVDFLAVLYASS